MKTVACIIMSEHTVLFKSGGPWVAFRPVVCRLGVRKLLVVVWVFDQGKWNGCLVERIIIHKWQLVAPRLARWGGSMMVVWVLVALWLGSMQWILG